jgi:hypothetical protein
MANVSGAKKAVVKKNELANPILGMSVNLPKCTASLYAEHMMPAFYAVITAYNNDEIAFKTNYSHAAFTHLLASLHAFLPNVNVVCSCHESVDCDTGGQEEVVLN